MGLKTPIRKWIAAGRFRAAVAKLLYDMTIALELAIERILDSVHTIRESPCRITADYHLTAIVKTFERPRLLRRLLASIMRTYPSLKVIVVDDSSDPTKSSGAETIFMPYDSGVSVGRNEALRHVTTKYVMVLDDDFVFYRHTDLEASLAVMENHPEIDIVGGEVIDLPLFETGDYSREALFPTDAEATMPRGTSLGGLPVYDKTPNFFIARTDRIRLVGWDPELRRVDHADFFTRAKGVLTTVFNQNMKCLHARTPFDSAYMRKREEVERDLEILRDRYSCAAGRQNVSD